MIAIILLITQGLVNLPTAQEEREVRLTVFTALAREGINNEPLWEFMSNRFCRDIELH